MRRIFVAASCLIIASVVYSEELKKSTNRFSYEKQPECLTSGCTEAASNILTNIDQSIQPCDDFYEFACGGFIKNNVLPDDKPNLISFNIIGGRLIKQLRTILEEPIQVNEPKTFTLLKHFYNVCLNTSAIEIDNLKTAKAIINSFGGWPVLEGSTWTEKNFDWKNLTYKFRNFGFSTDNLLTVYTGAYPYNSSQNIIKIYQADMSLDREYLVNGTSNKMVNAYYNYIVDLAVALGANKDFALADLKDAVEFYIELAKITLPKEDLRNATALTNIMTVSELQHAQPDINWIEHLNNIINLPNVLVKESELVDVAIPKYITDLNQLLNRTPKRVQSNFLISEAVMSMVSYLTQTLKNRQMEYHKLFQGTLAMKPRWEECVASAASLKIAVGALYVRKYFDEDAKTSATTLFGYIHKELIKILQEVDWMDEHTRKRALRKIAKMEAHVAYPSEFLDDAKIDKYYSKLHFDTDNYLNLSLSIYSFLFGNQFQNLHDPVNKTDWREHASASSVDAYYNMVENSVQLPAGILQIPFFGTDRPNYLNFGAMGFAIGHEITHGFDDLGRQYDEDGTLVDWWEGETAKAFSEKAQCIIDQYNNYTDRQLNLRLNGINTQGENIADNGAVKLSYLAYETWIKHNGNESHLPGINYTPKQLFWIALTHMWCSKERKEFTAQNILSNSHPPSRFRIIGSCSSSEYFSRDFNCPLGSNMNPSRKCHTW